MIVKNQATRLKTSVTIGLALLTVVGISVVAYRGPERILSSARSVEHSLSVLNLFRQAGGQLKEAQGIQMAYQGSRSDVLVERFNGVAADIKNKLAQLSELTRNDKRHQTRLKAVMPVIQNRLRLSGENPQVMG